MGKRLRGEFLPSGGRLLLLLFALPPPGLGAGRRGRRPEGAGGGGSGEAALEDEASAASASAASAALSFSFPSSSSSRSAPSVPAALSACCSLASSRKAAKMSVGTRSRWPRSFFWKFFFFFFFFFFCIVFLVFSEGFERNVKKRFSLVSLFTLAFDAFFLSLTCLNSTPSLW